MNPLERSPSNNNQQLANALRELGASPAEVDEWLPVVSRLGDWPAYDITPADTRRLLSVLAPSLAPPSPIRQAIRQHLGQRSPLIDLLSVARIQVSVLRPAFWVISALIVLAGMSFELASVPLDRILLIRALGPLLVYLGITTALRGVKLHTLESELACPASAVQLTVARIVVVLGYDVALGLVLSIPIWLGGSDGAIAVTLHWLTPLLLVAGLALVLSLRLDVMVAAGIAYAAWIGALTLAYAGSLAALHLGAHVPVLPSLVVEVALGLAGLALLVTGVLQAPKAVETMLPPI